MKPNLEILGPWLRNRGDELMLWAVARHFDADVRLGVSSNLGLDRFPDRPALYKIKWPAGIRETLGALGKGNVREVARLCRDTALLASRPGEALFSRGWIPGRRLDVMLDCSGYGYGDMWSLYRMGVRARYFAALKRQGTTVAMLPQAFGPFEKPEIRDAMRSILEQCDLVFARDEESRRHLAGLGIDRLGKIPVAPDVTHLLDGEPPADREDWFRRIAIVPNTRMLDRTSDTVRNGYIDFLARAVRSVKKHGLEPVLLIHEDNDLPLVRQLSATPGCECPIFHDDALHLKGMLGAVRGVVASRYHACVSALSQGVPTIGTSWNHKYDALFDEYGCADLLLSPDGAPELLDTALARLIDATERERLASRLALAAGRQKQLVRGMWQKVDALVARSAAARRAKAAPVASEPAVTDVA